MPRFVILEHDWPERHFDFMLEGADGRLLTWRLPHQPTIPCELNAEPIADHRRDYLDYEGPVSGNRGSVTRREFGEFDWLKQTENEIRIKLTLCNRLVVAEWKNDLKTWTFRQA